MSALTTEIEKRLEEETGLYIAIEEAGDRLVLTGIVAAEGERDAAIELARRFAPDRTLEDNIEVQASVPGQLEAREITEEDQVAHPGGNRLAGDEASLEAGDFTDQRLQKSPQRAPGPDSSLYDDEVAEGDNVYVPPSDPPTRGREVVGGLQADSMEQTAAEPSALDSDVGDEALRDAILRELREDQATTDLEIDVEVHRKVARLRGRVADLDDAENAEEVAARVPGLVEVIEELDVDTME